MTKRLIFWGVLFFVSTWVMAAEPLSALQNIEAQRTQIAAARSLKEGEFVFKQEACYQHFAVNDCLLKIKRARRVVMDAIRKQEVALNDLERQASAQAELERIQANTGPERQAEIQLQEEQALKAAVERQSRIDEKQATSSQAASAPVAPAKLAVPATVLNVQENEKAYADKVQEAKQRRVDNATNLVNQGPSTVKPLPLPR